jgi:hypothetical protein
VIVLLDRLPKVKRKLKEVFQKRSKPLYSMTGEDLYTSEIRGALVICMSRDGTSL